MMLSLIPYGLYWSASNVFGFARVELRLSISNRGPWYGANKAGNVALAFCAAALRVRQEEVTNG